MNIGILSAFGSTTPPDLIAAAGRGAEQRGLHSIWVPEHVVLFSEYASQYPYSEDGRIPMDPAGDLTGALEPLTALAFLAAHTERIRLGTGICLVPQRNPIYTAKEFATLDWLSGGRVDFGIGVGWCKEEVIACGYRFEDRGARCDEFLELMKKLWTEPVTSFKGEHFELAGCRMDPKPVQKPSIPIIVGGHGKPSLRRAARSGAGWYGFAISPELTAPILRDLDAALAAEGRSRDGFEIVITPPAELPNSAE